MDSSVKKLYENCKAHMKHTAVDWDKAVGAFIKLYDKLDAYGKEDCLEAYNRLAEEIEGHGEI